jgi:IS5 family transposase
MLIAGYCFGIRSERRLCEEVHLNLAYRWFCRLGLEGDVPDHSTFSKTRHGRFREAGLLRELFETVVRRCIAEGLVGGEGFAVDASMIVADAHRQRGIETAGELDPKAKRAVAEYLATLDNAAFGAATPVEPKFLSPVDPAARWTASWGGPAVYAYCTNYLVDVENAIIVDVEASTAVRQAEVTAAKTMIERTHDEFGLWPERLIAGTGYGSAEMLNWLVHERGIEPHIPVFDKSKRKDGTFSREDFTYDHKADAYVCPAGKKLRQRQKTYRMARPLVDEDGMMRYRASKLDCDACALKPRCCPNQPARKVPRSIFEGARDMARDIAKSGTYQTSRYQRKKVEMLFAHLKRILKLDRLRLRGPCGARDEFHLAAIAQNLRKLAKICSAPASIPAS